METPITEETPIENEGQLEVEEEANLGNEETPEVLEDNELDPQENFEETPTEPEDNFYTPEEMRTLQVDGIDTSRIPPEMQPLYQAMQAPITRKSMELSEQLGNLGQGNTPPQQAPQAPQAPVDVDAIATNVVLRKLGLQEEPEAWDPNYKNFILEVSDVRRDIKANVQQRQTALSELNSFKSGFTPEQFATIDNEAETKMYKLLADPKTQAEGQRIQQAVKIGDTKTVLAFTREIAKEVLSRTPVAKKSNTPPRTNAPTGNVINTGTKDPSKMSNEEYRAYRNAQ